jgi:hypothetical protein
MLQGIETASNKFNSERPALRKLRNNQQVDETYLKHE